MTGRYLRPADVAQALVMKAETRGVFACGFTALQLGWKDAGPAVATIDVSGLDFGPEARLEGGAIVLAANAPLSRLARSPLVAEALPVLKPALRLLGSASVRNLGSLGGNLMWGAGDLETLFAALGARLRFADCASALVAARETWPAGGLLTAIEAAPAPQAFYEKLGFRAAFSPARLVVAGARRAGGIQAALRYAGEGVRCGDPAALVGPEDDAYLARVARALLAGQIAALGEAA